MLNRILSCGVLAALTLGTAGTAWATRYADVLGYYEPGLNVGTVDIGFGGVTYDNPDAALGGPSELRCARRPCHRRQR